MSELDPIQEIELLSLNFLSQDSNLDEYEDVDATVLSPRRVPVGRGTRGAIGNAVTEEEDDDDDEQTHSSGFSSSIQKTVKDIDGVLNEIRVRSSPDPDDFVFRSGNRQYYNGDYYDDDAMTETSFQTNTNLFLELNKADESFMGSTSKSKNDSGLLGERNDDSDENDNDFENENTLNSSWLRSGEPVANVKYEKRRNRYKNNHIEHYENDYAYSPEKILASTHSKDESIMSRDLSFYSSENDSSDGEQEFYVRDYWNELPYSEEDLEEARSRVNRCQQRGKKKRSPTSFLGSKLKSFWYGDRKVRRYERQPQEELLHQQDQQSPRREEVSTITLRYSKKETRLFWVATVCSTLAILFVITAALVLGIAPAFSGFKQKAPNATAILDHPPSMINSSTIYIDGSTESTTGINTSTIYIDEISEPIADAPTIVPMVPATPSPMDTTPDVPVAQPSQLDTTWAPTEVTSTLAVSEATSDVNEGSLDRPQHGSLPISGIASPNKEYVTDNMRNPDASSDNREPTNGNLPVSGGSSQNNNVNNNIDKNTVSTVAKPVFASLPISGSAPKVDSTANHDHRPEEESVGMPFNQHEATTVYVQRNSSNRPTSSTTKFEKKKGKRRTLEDNTSERPQRKSRNR